MSAALTAPERWREKMKDAEVWRFRPELSAVFGIEHEGARWLLATDGHVLLMEQTDREGTAWTGKEEEGLRSVLTPGEESRGEINVADLLAWTGAPQYPRGNGCDLCDGRGTFKHSCDCPFCTTDSEDCLQCGGVGVDLAPACRSGWLFGGAFDRNLLAQVLAEIPTETMEVRMKKNATGEYTVVHFLSPTVRGVVTGLWTAASSAPRFGEAAAAAVPA
jgi:Zn-finger nucleic acid-binding protein